MTDSNPPDNMLEKNDDPFKEFEHWLKDGPAGKWPTFDTGSINESQHQISRMNAGLLQSRDLWNARANRFSNALSLIEDPEERASVLSRYAIYFFDLQFEEHLRFIEYKFPIQLIFLGNEFSGTDVEFLDCIFSGLPIRFEGCFLKGNLIFVNCEFNRCGIRICWCSFEGGSIDFSYNRIFENYLEIIDLYEMPRNIELIGSGSDSFRLLLENLTIEGNFISIELHAKQAMFRGLSVGGRVDFSGSVFDALPDFRQSDFSRITEVAQMSVPAPRLVRKRSWLISDEPDDVLICRRLKAMAIAANDHEKDGEFFAYEMMAKRGVEHTTFWQLLFNTIYWKVSFYGQSYLYPLGWLGASFVTFAAIYSLMAALPIGGWQSLAFGITYSVKNSLPFLGTLTRSVPSPEGHVSWFALQLQAIKDAQPGPDWFTVLGTGQAMLSLFFFFFLLLGLRNKFRLK